MQRLDKNRKKIAEKNLLEESLLSRVPYPYPSINTRKADRQKIAGHCMNKLEAELANFINEKTGKIDKLCFLKLPSRYSASGKVLSVSTYTKDGFVSV